MEKRDRKTAHVTFRVTPEQKALLKRGAALAGSDVTSFVLAPAIARSRELEERSRVTILTGEARKRFIDLMENAPAPSARLIDNLRDSRHRIVD